MAEKIVNVGVLKEKAKSAGQKTGQKAKQKITTTGSKLKKSAADKRSKVLNAILDKGIQLTEKQLSSLKNIKKKRS